MPRFSSEAAFVPEVADWQWLPFRFERRNGSVICTNMVGEHLILSSREFADLAEKRLPTDSGLVRRLRAVRSEAFEAFMKMASNAAPAAAPAMAPAAAPAPEPKK
jgi:hypothetical protein